MVLGGVDTLANIFANVFINLDLYLAVCMLAFMFLVWIADGK